MGLLKTSEILRIHQKAVMLYLSEMSEMDITILSSDNTNCKNDIQ